MTNTLYYGDNLPILRSMPSESVDLIYLDPPFNSNRSYNVLFKDERVRSPEHTALLVCSSANTPCELKYQVR
jgi:DNA modification methylase